MQILEASQSEITFNVLNFIFAHLHVLSVSAFGFCLHMQIGRGKVVRVQLSFITLKLLAGYHVPSDHVHI